MNAKKMICTTTASTPARIRPGSSCTEFRNAMPPVTSDRSFGSGQQPHLLHLLLLKNIHYVYHFFVADAFIARNYHWLLGIYGLLPFDCFDEFVPADFLFAACYGTVVQPEAAIRLDDHLERRYGRRQRFADLAATRSARA